MPSLDILEPKQRLRTLKDMLHQHSAPAAEALIERKTDGAVQCFACGHRCLVKPGRDGVCRVRFNENGTLLVPHGYVGALACDPIEKKPFFHVLPGSDALTFGMLGCDYHCGYCFPGETIVATDRGLVPFTELFASAVSIEHRADADIATPDDLRAVAASGTLRKVRAVFRHPYRGRLTVIRPQHLGELRCTPDHRIYVTDDARVPPAPLQAQYLTPRHLLAIPRRFALAENELSSVLGAASVRETEQFYLLPLRELTSIHFDGDVYNMEVEEEHNYLAGLLLVSNCQNWVTSQMLRDPEAVAPPREVTPRQLVDLAIENGAPVVASSYNEPLITSEWAVDVFKEAKRRGLRCAYISNGNGTPQVLDFIRPYVDAYKVDLKAFNDKAYRQLGGVLENVTSTIRMLKERGFWVEIVTLVVPGFSDAPDDLKRMAEFLASVDPLMPWHMTAFHPDYKMTDGFRRTGVDDLMRVVEFGRQAGLKYLYPGNLPGQVGEWENTRCHHCGATVIKRYGFYVMQNRVGADGRCPDCRKPLPGVWGKPSGHGDGWVRPLL